VPEPLHLIWVPIAPQIWGEPETSPADPRPLKCACGKRERCSGPCLYFAPKPPPITDDDA
jgi:hypothetical protein